MEKLWARGPRTPLLVRLMLRMGLRDAQDEAMNAKPVPVRKSAYDFPMFDRSNAGIADRMSAPMDQAHMPIGMGDTKNGH